MFQLETGTIGRWAIAICVLGALVSPALAVDGVIEINQARALKGGVSAGDAPGFPVTISAAGSYRLTGDLTVSSDVDAVEITASNVTLDLNGFSIVGYGSAGASALGIRLTAAANVEIRNGTVRDTPYTAIGGDETSTDTRAIDLRVIDSGGYGIALDDRAVVRNCVVVGSGQYGIWAGWGSIIEGNFVDSSEAGGINLQGDCRVAGNTVLNNGTTTTHNGILTGGCVIVGNTSNSNAGDGIEAGASSTVIDNLVGWNADYGLNLHALAGYAGNVISVNSNGTVTGGVEMGGNVCDGNTTCP